MKCFSECDICSKDIDVGNDKIRFSIGDRVKLPKKHIEDAMVTGVRKVFDTMGHYDNVGQIYSEDCCYDYQVAHVTNMGELEITWFYQGFIKLVRRGEYECM